MAFTASATIIRKEVGGYFTALARVVHRVTYGVRPWSNAFGADFGPLAS